MARESGLGAEIGDGHALLQREGAGHDLAVDGAELVVGDGAGIVGADAVEHGAFAVGGVDLLAGGELDFADGQHMARAFVEQPDDLRVQFIDRLTMFRKAHLGKEECRIRDEESNLFRNRAYHPLQFPSPPWGRRCPQGG
jgi:hypothetical protein